MESELKRLRNGFSELQEKHETITSDLKSTKSDKLALVKAVKKLRNEREEMDEQYKNEISNLRLTNLNEEKKLRTEYDNKILRYKTDIREMRKMIEDSNLQYKRQIDTLHKSLGDVIDKLNTFTKTLDNAALSEFRKNSPNMSEMERIKISNNILEGLFGMIEDALSDAETKHTKRQDQHRRQSKMLFQNDDLFDDDNNDDNGNGFMMNTSLNSSVRSKDSKESKESKDSGHPLGGGGDSGSGTGGGDSSGEDNAMFAKRTRDMVSPRLQNKFELSLILCVS